MGNRTIGIPQTQPWELLGQLALCGQNGAPDEVGFLQQVVALLQSATLASWGELTILRHGKVVAQSHWGIRAEMAGIAKRKLSIQSSPSPMRLPFYHGHHGNGKEEIGYLLLAQDDECLVDVVAHAPNEPFFAALAAQLGLLFTLHDVREHQQEPQPELSPPMLELPPVMQGDQHNGNARPAELIANQALLDLIYTMAQVPSTNQHTLEIYHEVLKAIAHLVVCERAFLVVYDHKNKVAPVVMQYGMSGSFDRLAFPLVDNPVVEWLETNQRPLIISHAQNNPLLSSLYALLEAGKVQSVVLLPLLSYGMIIGCIELDFIHPLEPIPTHYLMVCETLAAQLARVVENTRLATQAEANAQALEGKVGELSTLLEAARILGSLLQPDEVLNNLMDLVRHRLGVTSVALWKIGKDSYLRPLAMYGIPIAKASEMRVPIGKGLTGKVAETGKPLIVYDVYEQGGSLYPNFNRQNQLVSFMGVPIFYHEQIIGVLSVMTSHHYHFNEDERMLLAGLAGQAAIALENARLFQDREQRINELTTINSISTAVNATLKLDELLQVLHRGISEIVDTTQSFIALYDAGSTNQTPVLRQRITRQAETFLPTNNAIPLDGKGLLDYVVLEGKPLLLNTQEEIADFLKHRTIVHNPMHTNHSLRLTPNDNHADNKDDLAAWLGIPIILSDAILGVIVVQSNIPYAFSEDHRRFISTVASHAAVAISNARLFSERERRLREITVLKDVGNAISSTLDLQGALERLCYELGQAVDMSTSLIGIYQEKTNIISYPVCYDQNQRIYLEPAPLGEGPTAWAIRNRQPLLLLNAEQATQMGLSEFGYSVFDVRSGQSRIRLPRSRPVESAIITPIISNDVVLGVISIKSYKPYTFDEDDLRFVMTVANQLGVTITNIFMFQEREQRINELGIFNEIGQELSRTVSIDELPMLIYRQTSRLLDTTNFYMALFDEDKGEVSFPLFYQQGVCHTIGVTQHNMYYVAPTAISINPGLYNFILYLIRRVIYKRESLLLRGSDLDHVDLGNINELQEEIGTVTTSFSRPRSWLGVPMLVADKVVGVIGIQNYEDAHAYIPYDAHLLSTIASWAAISLENARLFEQIRTLAANLEQRVAERTLELEEANKQLVQEKDYLQTVHAITLELTSMLDLSKIINRALEITSTNLGVSRGSIMLRKIEDGMLMCRAVLLEQGRVETAEVPIYFEKGEGLAGWVMQHQTAVYIEDVTKDPRWIVETGKADDVRSVVVVPLMISNSTLGVLSLSSKEVDYFSESQVRLLATIANEVAIAINNAQLYDYINEIANRNSELLEQQKEENTRREAILQSLTEGVIVLDEDNNLQLVNAAAEEMLDIPAMDVLQKPLITLETYGKTDEQYERASILCSNLQQGLDKVRELQTSYTTAIDFPNPVQTIAMNVAQVINQDERRYGHLAVLRDITREIESDRIKREFIANVTHELNTPLTAIKGFVDLLLLQWQDTLNSEQLRHLHVVQNNTKRLIDLIKDILTISKIDSGKIKLKFQPVDVEQIIADVVESLELEAQKKRLEVTVDIQPDFPQVMADPKRLTQICLNLFSNAVKYTFEGGRIQIRAYLNHAQMVQVDVEDTGVGMTPEQCEKLFRPFYRADNPLREQAGGTGLGLSITKSLVEQHGGVLWVTSEQNKGSIFSFILPLEHPEANDDEADEDNE